MVLQESGGGVASVDAEVEGEGYLLAHGNALPFRGWKLHARASKGTLPPPPHNVSLLLIDTLNFA
jgi:hypothetical protein